MTLMRCQGDIRLLRTTWTLVYELACLCEWARYPYENALAGLCVSFVLLFSHLLDFCIPLDLSFILETAIPLPSLTMSIFYLSCITSVVVNTWITTSKFVVIHCNIFSVCLRCVMLSVWAGACECSTLVGVRSDTCAENEEVIWAPVVKQPLFLTWLPQLYPIWG